jgi:2-polyprenyl-3-methyl-5-hydroxy-6-metoxy-1,4-benzoquinol methylase
MDLQLRLRVSPAFSFALMPDGRPYVAQETEPYLQYWLSDRERELWAAFTGRRGAVPADVAAAHPAAEGKRRLTAIAGMLQAGVLVPLREDSSRYDQATVRPYLEHRPFPPEIAAQIVARTGVGPGRSVIDLAGGPGDLALQLAATGADVTLMDWSRAFLASARGRAHAQGLPLRTVHESCNRLVRDDGSYDVVTVSQALHWLDDVAVCRGVLRVLREGGSFIVVHSAFDVPARHPLAHVLGADSVLGAKPRQPFAREVQALHDRVHLLLRALDTRGVERFDPTQRHRPLAGLHSAGIARFRQTRPLGMGFLRGLLTPRHIELAGLEVKPFWHEAEARCKAARAAELIGTHDWALLHFQRGMGRAVAAKAARSPVQAIGCGAPAEGR